MNYFYLSAAILLLVAAFFVVVPVIRLKSEHTAKLNTADWFKTRQQELKQELASEQLNVDQYQQAIVELKQRAAEELSSDSQGYSSGDRSTVRIAWAACLILLIGSSIGMYWRYGAQPQMQKWEVVMAQLPVMAGQILEQNSKQPTLQDLSDLALGLRTRLTTEKNDAVGWMFYGRILFSLQDVKGSIAALEKAYSLSPHKTEIIISLARSLLTLDDERQWQRALALLSAPSNNQPKDEMIVILSSVAHMKLANFQDAKAELNTLQQMLGSDDPRQTWVVQQLSTVEEQSKTALNGDSKISAKLNISVDVSPTVKKDIQAFSHLFVFAKTDAMPMPVAVKKIPIESFPITVTLSDQDGIMPTMKLSSLKSVTLIARLSRDEEATRGTGDLQTELKSVPTSQSSVIHLVIDKAPTN